MEYKSLYFSLYGVFAYLAWSFSYWKFFSKSRINIKPSNKKSNGMGSLLRLTFFVLGSVAFGYISYSLTFPRKAKSFMPNTRDVNDIFIVVDVSRSMLAEDLKPNRLEVAKKKLEEFASLRPTDRFGIIIFSEKVFTLLPLTTDAGLISKVMKQINVGQLGSGTNIGDALGLAVARGQASNTKNKSIVLLTDGVSNVGALAPLEAAEKAKEYNIKVYTIGLASNKDARIPIGTGLFGKTYQKIPGGSIDMKTLENISKLTGGKSFRAQNPGSLKNILSEIEKLERTKINVNSQIVYEELYYSYLFIGILLLILTELGRFFVLREVW